jgi:hypothetical protein
VLLYVHENQCQRWTGAVWVVLGPSRPLCLHQEVLVSLLRGSRRPSTLPLRDRGGQRKRGDAKHPASHDGVLGGSFAVVARKDHDLSDEHLEYLSDPCVKTYRPKRTVEDPFLYCPPSTALEDTEPEIYGIQASWQDSTYANGQTPKDPGAQLC